MIVYIFFRMFLTLFNLLPRRAAIFIGVLVGRLWYLLDARHRRVAKSNLTAVFSKEKSYIEICQIARSVFVQIAVNAAEMCRIEKFTAPAGKKLVAYDGYEDIKQAIDRGKGVIVLVSHFGNWEMIGLAAHALKKKTTVIAKSMRNKRIDKHIVKQRNHLFLEPVPKHHVAGQIIKVLRGGGIVAIMIDQAAGRTGEMVDFMGRKASTITSPALFAQKTGAAVISVFIERDSSYKYRIMFQGPHPLVDTGNIKQDVLASTENFNKTLESAVRKRPDHWFWIHRRWKPTPNPNVPRKFNRAENILLCMPNWIGDIVMAMPTLKYLRDLYPDSRITLLVRKHLADMVRGHPAVDDVIAYEYNRGPKGQLKNLNTIKLIRRRFFDLAVILPDSFRAALWIYLAGIPLRVGYSYEGRDIFLNQRIKRERWEVDQIQRFLELPRMLGKIEADPIPKLVAPEKERIWAGEFLEKQGINSEAILVGLNPGASYGPAKCWPVERYCELGKKLLEDSRVRIVIFGGPDQSHVSDEVESSLSAGTINLGGKTDLKQLMAMIERCKVMVSNDTGPMHMAAGLGVHTIALFGSTNPEKTSPPANTDVIYHKQECSPCLQRTCDRGLECMHAITIDEVFNKVREYL